MSDLETLLLGGAIGLGAIALWKGLKVLSTPATTTADDNYAYADSHPGTPLPAGVFGPAVPTLEPISGGLG